MTPQAVSPPIHLAERERPFWGFAEVLLVAALFLPAVWVGGVVVQIVSTSLHRNSQLGLPLLIAQFLAYGIIFGVLWILFARHGRPLFESLAWVPQPFQPRHLVILGVGLAATVIILGNLLGIPNTETPFDKLLSDTASRIGIALFGVTLGPIIEELLFRGFLQPVLVDSMGVFPGILATSVLFGALHLAQNADIWQSGVLITLVGFVLGVVRHVSGSTRASAITHISYNALPFLSLIVSGAHPSKP
ncbi:MAG TPA: type II CAAX endopeptidase family protein [Bryobacteraceae bacterium]|nr:type II CAAX endopeptidase family protein [Bryobacteraceae bacterium]